MIAIFVSSDASPRITKTAGIRHPLQLNDLSCDAAILRSKQKTSEVFIIESLRKEDHEALRLEGHLIDQLLKMGGRKPIYRLVESVEQMIEAIRYFSESQYRYLHLSCHGNKKNFEFYFGAMSFEEFVNLLHGKLENRRVFVSACEAVNNHLAEQLIPNTRCYSVIGPLEPIRFDDAPIIWTSYYYLAFKNDLNIMNRRLILKTLKALTKFYQVNLNYYLKSRKSGVKLNQFSNNLTSSQTTR